MSQKISRPSCLITEGSWLDFREDVRKVNLELFKIIEQIDPNKTFKLIKARYSYGNKITDTGTICIPDICGRLSRLDNPNISEVYKEQLSYSPTPLVLQLTNAAEVFIESNGRTIPLNLFLPGDLFGLFEAVTTITHCPTVPIWNVTAGARSVIMIPRITDAVAHKRLRTEFSISNPPPKRLTDHWYVFTAIANKAKIPWVCEVLIFTKNWFQNHDDDINWLRFQKYLLISGWQQSQHMRSRIEFNAIWESFASEICRKNLKPNSYVVDTIKHLAALATGQIPAFKPVDDSELTFPSKIIEDAYLNTYLLKTYAPTLMHAWRLKTPHDNSSIYYSLAYPTLLEGTPAIRRAPSLISEMREIKLLMKTLNQTLNKQTGNQYDPIKNASYEYFHGDKDQFDELLDSADIAESDPIIKASFRGKFRGRILAKNSQFFKGCIQINNIKKS